MPWPCCCKQEPPEDCTVEVTVTARCQYTATFDPEPGNNQVVRWTRWLCSGVDVPLTQCIPESAQDYEGNPLVWTYPDGTAIAARRIIGTLYDANNQPICQGQADFVGGCQSVCCELGIPETLTATITGFTLKNPLIAPASLVAVENALPATVGLEYVKTVVDGLGTVHVYVSPDIVPAGVVDEAAFAVVGWLRCGIGSRFFASANYFPTSIGGVQYDSVYQTRASRPDELLSNDPVIDGGVTATDTAFSGLGIDCNGLSVSNTITIDNHVHWEPGRSIQVDS